MDYIVTSASITTKTSIITKDAPVEGSLQIGGQNYALEIEGHGGNWTWNQPKKPYGIKLKDHISILGLEPGKKFVLLANWADHSYVNTALAMTIGSRFTVWTPNFRFLDLTLNNQYVGIYQLIESVKLGPERINSPPVHGTSIPGITGTYLMEINNQGHDPGFRTKDGVSFIWDDPDGSVPEQDIYIENWLNRFEDALYAPDAFTRTGPTSYRSMIDGRSMAIWYLIEELGSNQDSDFSGSCKIYKTPDTTNGPGKLVMGPLWDFDISFGNRVNEEHPANALYTRRDGAKWLIRMFQDPGFFEEVQFAWADLKNNVIGPNAKGLSDLISKITANIYSAAAADKAKWGYSYNADGDWSFNPIDYATYPTKIAWVQARVKFLDGLYGIHTNRISEAASE